MMKRRGEGVKRKTALRTMMAALAVVAAASGGWGARLAQGSEGGCGNEAIRKQEGATGLPDCRAYEVVSPTGARPNTAISSVTGGAVAWNSHFPPQGPAGTTGGTVYLSRRGATGAPAPGAWSTVGVVPPQSSRPNGLFHCQPSIYFSPDLSQGVLSAGIGSLSLKGDGSEPCENHNEPKLEEAPGVPVEEPEGAQNLLLTKLGLAGPAYWRLVNRTPSGVAPANAWMLDGSTVPGEEFSHLVFAEEAQLIKGAPEGLDLYEWVDGMVRLVSYLPSGQPVAGSLANEPFHSSGEEPEEPGLTGAGSFTNAVSRDGSRVFFTATGRLYVRLHAEAEPDPHAVSAPECVASTLGCTIQVDASQAGGPGGGGTFLTANPAGTEVFFIDGATAKLTANTETGSGENLYEYEVDSGRLIDLTGSQAQADVLGYSGFGEQEGGVWRLYFVAEGTLGAAGAVAGEPNLDVVSNEGGAVRITHIATLNREEDARDWGTERKLGTSGPSIELLKTRVSPDGRLLAFTSVETQALAGYDNTAAKPQDCSSVKTIKGNPLICPEIFLYEAGGAKTVCISCDPSGAAPTGPAEIGGPVQPQDRGGPGYMNRQVLNDGRVFFDSPDALVKGDINGVADVYEYDHGRLALISSGTATSAAHFEDASESGSDVFLRTSATLVPSEPSHGEVTLYDARQEGGLPAPPVVAECGGESCKGAVAAPPLLAPPASVSFAGPGNRAPALHKHRAKTRPPKRVSRAKKLARAIAGCRHRFRRSRLRRRSCMSRARSLFGRRALRSRRRRARPARWRGRRRGVGGHRSTVRKGGGR